VNIGAIIRSTRSDDTVGELKKKKRKEKKRKKEKKKEKEKFFFPHIPPVGRKAVHIYKVNVN